MGYRVEFDYDAWVLAYPAFANLSEALIVTGSLPIAEIYWRNDGTSPAPSPEVQQTLLWLAVAHVTQLLYGTNGNKPAPSGLVGRVNTATEGSVSVGTADFPEQSPSAAWWMQTQYGSAFWQATAAYRTMHYVPGPTRYFGGRFFPF